jgi:hypothetical protein
MGQMAFTRIYAEQPDLDLPGVHHLYTVHSGQVQLIVAANRRRHLSRFSADRSQDEDFLIFQGQTTPARHLWC